MSATAHRFRTPLPGQDHGVAAFRDRLLRARQRFAYTGSDAQDALALQALAPLSGPFLPWTDSSMRPSAIVRVLSDVVFNRRSRIVECGSGNSTIFLGRLLVSRGMTDVHVHSLDQEARWADTTREALEREGLDGVVSVVTAPLVDGWYDRSALPQVDGIDLLIVDGPPAYEDGNSHARSPALTVFGPSLAEGATIFVDDAERAGEQEVIAQWEREHGLRFRRERGDWAVATR